MTSISRATLRFFSETTAHGFAKIASSPNRRRKTVWSFLCAAAWTSLTFLIFHSFEHYDATQTVTDVRMVPMNDTDFPCITFAFLRPDYKAYMTTIPDNVNIRLMHPGGAPEELFPSAFIKLKVLNETDGEMKMEIFPGLHTKSPVNNETLFHSYMINRSGDINSTGPIVIYMRENCEDQFLLNHYFVGFVTPAIAYIQINVDGKEETINKIAGDSDPVYPHWFPDMTLKTKPEAYDRMFCRMMCQWMNDDRMKDEIDKFVATDFYAEWSHRSNNITDGNVQSAKPSDGTRTDCSKDDCPFARTTGGMKVNSYVIRRDELSGESVDSNHTQVYLSLSSPIMARKEIRFQKSVFEFISEIGGHMGLLVGASALTAIEVLEFLVKVFKILCGAEKKKRKDSRGADVNETDETFLRELGQTKVEADRSTF